MNFSRFFIDRPIFAGVLSVLILLGGLISLGLLPVSEYPEVAPPSVVVRATYPGANPKVIAETVATPLEESINGVENMLYMSSQATTDGGTTSGYSEIGSRLSEISPPRSVRTDSTPAKIGRAMKNRERFIAPPAGRAPSRAGPAAGR